MFDTSHLIKSCNTSGAPSPLAGEGGMTAHGAVMPGEGYLSAQTVLVETYPSPNRVCGAVLHALSRKGRGRSHWHRGKVHRRCGHFLTNNN
jgi:ATP sulfurylase